MAVVVVRPPEHDKREKSTVNGLSSTNTDAFDQIFEDARKKIKTIIRSSFEEYEKKMFR